MRCNDSTALVYAHQRADHAGLPSELGEDRAGDGLGLLGHHADVLALGDRASGGLGVDGRDARGGDDTARAGNRRKRRLSALRAHTKVPYKIDLLWKTLRNAKAA